MKLSTIYKTKKYNESVYPFTEIKDLIERELDDDAIDEVDEEKRLQVRNIIDLYDEGNATTTDLAAIFFDGEPLGVYTAYGHEDSVERELYLSDKVVFKKLNDYLDTKKTELQNVYVDEDFDMTELDKIGGTFTDEYVLELDLELVDIDTMVEISTASFSDCFENELPDTLTAVIKRTNKNSNYGAYYVEVIDKHLEYKMEHGKMKTILLSNDSKSNGTRLGYQLSGIPSMHTFSTLIPSNQIVSAY